MGTRATQPRPTAGDIMTAGVRALAPDTPLEDAVEALARLGYSGAPVVDSDGNVVGIFSEHDCIRAMAEALYGGWPTGTVGDHMSAGADTVDAAEDVLTVASRFADGRHRRIPVLSDGRLVGLISRRDLMRSLHGLLRRAGEPKRPPTTYELIEARRR